MKGREVEELATYLKHTDMRVRLDAQFELVQRKEAEILATAVGDESHGIRSFTWSLGIGTACPAG